MDRVLRHLHKLGAGVAFLLETPLTAQDFHRLKKLWVGEIYGSLAKGTKGGVVTLINKKCPYTTSEQDRDDRVRRISITLRPQGTEETNTILITNIYAPNSPSITYFNELTDWFTHTEHFTQIVGGDFNSTMCTEEYGTKTQPHSRMGQAKHLSPITLYRHKQT